MINVGASSTINVNIVASRTNFLSHRIRISKMLHCDRNLTHAILPRASLLVTSKYELHLSVFRDFLEAYFKLD